MDGIHFIIITLALPIHIIHDTCPPLSDLLMSRCLSCVSAVSQVDCCPSGDGVVSEGPAVGAGGGADHIWTASAPPGADEGGEEDLQVGP